CVVSACLLKVFLWTIASSKPCAPLIFARHTSAMPPAARRDSISYLLNSFPGTQGDGVVASPATASRRTAPDSPGCTTLDGILLSSLARSTCGMGDQRRKH